MAHFGTTQKNPAIMAIAERARKRAENRLPAGAVKAGE
jgi:hypothetical protein